jgi:putative nucleotidyltransferase with HDIG domain
MTESSRLILSEELIRRFASGLRNSQLYAPTHPLVARSTEALLQAVRQLHALGPVVTLGIVGTDLVVGDLPLPKASATLGELIRRLQAVGIERITIDLGVTADEFSSFVREIGALSATADRGGVSVLPDNWPGLKHIRVGRITSSEPGERMASDINTLRRVYSNAVKVAEALWDSSKTEGMPDVHMARTIVDGLAEAVTHNRTALVALTAMRNYDNYTFTHMVNVSILTMGQARALGIEGRLLCEFGLAALMHDVGKVRTPTEILTKPEKLTDAEFAIMKRHVVEGAEILRCTPEMPVLAPVVAFEHHLRLDGGGYPDGVRRDSLNVATMLCSIADVYDAMRSQRAYQQAFPTDRILAVLKRNDGRQFDQNLVRRFTQLMGIYPPGTLVRLSTGEVAVVVQVHAPDPYRPRVRLIFDAAGERLALVEERNLWEAPDDAEAASVVTPLDPEEFGLDPLLLL